MAVSIVGENLIQSLWLIRSDDNFPIITLQALLTILGVKGKSVVDQKDAVRFWLQSPSLKNMPISLKKEVNKWLSKDVQKQLSPTPECSPVVSDEGTITLPKEIEDQLPIIPDGVDIIEVSDELEKLFKPLLRVLQVFKGLPGNWITIRGNRIFLKAKGTRLRNFLEESLKKTEIESIADPVGPGIFPVTFKNGLKGIFRRGFKGQKEIQSYEVAKALGWDDLLPVTVSRSSKGEKLLLGDGAMSSFAPGVQIPSFKQKVFPLVGSRRLLPKVAEKDLARAATFDYLTGTKDRHAFNYFIQGKKLKLIDHEDIFPFPPRTPPTLGTVAAKVLQGPSSGGMFHPTVMNNDLFFVAVKRKVPLKTFIGDVNKVDWDALLRKLEIQPDTVASKGFFQRLRLLKEGAARGDDFSSLAGTPLFPKASDTIDNVFRFPIQPGDFLF